MPDNTFDIVSKIDLAEVNNAIQQARKELITRYDLKNSKSEIELNEKEHKIQLASQDEPPLRWPAGADAVEAFERKAQLLLTQADAYRELSSSLAHDDANA